MKLRNLFTIWVSVAMLAAFASNAAEIPANSSDDVVVDSFERELNHEAPQPKDVTRDSIDEDVLYERVNKPLQTPEPEASPSQGE